VYRTNPLTWQRCRLPNTSCFDCCYTSVTLLLQCVKGKLRGATTWLGIWAGVIIVVLTYYEINAAIM